MIGGLFDHLRSKLNWLALSVVKVGCGRALPGGEPKYKYNVQEVMNERGVRRRMKDRPEALYDATVRFLQAQTEPDIDFEVGEPEGNMTTALAIKRRWKPAMC